LPNYSNSYIDTGMMSFEENDDGVSREAWISASRLQELAGNFEI
jgi:hypothetical protein